MRRMLGIVHRCFCRHDQTGMFAGKVRMLFKRKHKRHFAAGSGQDQFTETFEKVGENTAWTVARLRSIQGEDAGAHPTRRGSLHQRHLPTRRLTVARQTPGAHTPTRRSCGAAPQPWHQSAALPPHPASAAEMAVACLRSDSST